MTIECGCSTARLTDRKNVVFPVFPENNIHGMRKRATVYNGFTIWMADREKNLSDAKIKNTHFIFTNETQSECYDVIEQYKNGCVFGNMTNIRRIK